MIGKTISHYEITQELGRGGMGIVYKANDLTLKRTVALKFLSPHLLTDPDQKARFLHEAQAAAVLEHPNISTIHEIHEADGHTFMVMAFIEGEDIGTKMMPGPMAVDKTLDIAVQVAKGLSKAHSEGIVHRDIKPGNVLITAEGHAKIVDFGLAKLATQTKLTKTGTTMGTVRYMSPEQARGDEVDHRTDIWSLGVMLYEMLAGRSPFRGDMEPAMMYSIMNEDPEPITSSRKDIPVALEDIIEKTLAKNPAKRYSTMDELLADLEMQRDQITLGIKEKQFTTWRQLKRRKRLSVGVVAAIILVIAIVLIQTFHQKSMAIDSVAVLPFVDLSGNDEEEYFSNGMTESLIIELGQISALRVISRTSVMRYKKTEKTLPEIAQELKVDAIVEASVRRDGNQVTIMANLIRAEPEQQLWGESYTRNLENILSIHSEVAQAIAEQIAVAVTPEERERLTSSRQVNINAYNAYLKGRFHTDKWTEEGFNEGIRYFKESIDIDPTYAMAYVGLADAYSARNFMAYAAPGEAERLTRAAVEKALSLDNKLGEAHAMLAWVKFSYDWDWFGPDADFQRAIKFSPNSPMVYDQYRVYLAITGRHDEAIGMARRALELDPLTETKEDAVVWCLMFARRYDEALAHIKKAQQSYPQFGQRETVLIYKNMGMVEEAVALADTILKYMGGIESLVSYPVMLSNIGQFYAEVGRTEVAHKVLELQREALQKRWINPFHVARVYAGLGEVDSTLHWLERSYQERTPSMVFSGGRGFDLLDGDPRYEDLLSRVGIPVERAHDSGE